MRLDLRLQIRDLLLGGGDGIGAGDKPARRLIVDVDATVPPTVQGDPGRLRQILVNLIGNAIKFTSHGEVVLRVTMEALTPQGIVLHFSVADTGVGIPLDRQKRVFEAFTQADGSTTRTYGGTGLGLTIATQLVALMGGRLWVESEVGKGSTFHVPALTDALATGTPLLLALTPARPAPRIAPDAVPVPLRDIDVASGCAADYDGWLLGGAA